MMKQLRILSSVAVVGAALALVVPIAAQQPAAPVDLPTKQNPLRFSAFNVSLQAGIAGTTDITIERWTTDKERESLLGLVETAKAGQGGQRTLLNALQKIKPRVGSIRTPNSLGWDLRYARENMLEDGTRQIVIATDKPVRFGAAARNSEAMDYPFTLIEMRMKPNDKGEGRMLAATSITVKNGRLELENYGQEPVRLTSITEAERKKK